VTVFASLYLLIPWCRIFFEKLKVTQLVKQYSAFFMEPEVSLPCSQKPTTTEPYPELYTPRSSQWFSHVRWVPCHHGIERPQVVDGGEGLQIRRVATNVLNKQTWTADKG
jgi:hypothetical protein